ncbi:aliphatic nitrilase/cyanide hydratase [Propionicimonas paludicola]|uniref:Aliphatic nitrilase/cyanide hydratase n=1 Tax=Propionicimonas paludicola TaxID=185243 RepID=A0A2A9CRB9_9ACTN|nr:carbon-nitrogen hydrolase family protein [Propionicimonas paludicola]PFG16666.1 aliphatic nitrilase/cyanide hydratase [Propionicimonas paludicola]
MASIRVAAVQAEPAWFDLAASTEKTIALIAQAAAGGVALVAFPETWLPGYPGFMWFQNVPEQLPMIAHYRANSAEVGGPEIAAIRAAAAEHQIMVVLGFSERDHGSLYMAQLIIGNDGEILLHRRKLKPTHVERALFGESDGSGLQVIETALGRLGALNCWEHMQPLVKFAMYAQHEQLHVAGWPGLADDGEALLPQLSGGACLALSRSYALEGSCFVIVPKMLQPGEADRDPGHGLSAVVFGPDGETVSEAVDPRVEGIVYADLDLAGVALAKAFADPVGHYSRPDLFTVSIDRTARRVADLGPDPVPEPIPSDLSAEPQPA